jgi:hypothetical protein
MRPLLLLQSFVPMLSTGVHANTVMNIQWLQVMDSRWPVIAKVLFSTAVEIILRCILAHGRHYGALPHLGCVSGVDGVKGPDLLLRAKLPQVPLAIREHVGISLAGSVRNEGLPCNVQRENRRHPYSLDRGMFCSKNQ